MLKNKVNKFEIYQIRQINNYLIKKNGRKRQHHYQINFSICFRNN